MTKHKALHPRYDIDSLYASRKEGERGLTSIQDSTDASKHRPENNIQKCRLKTDYSDQKQYKEHKDEKKSNNLKMNTGRKAIVCTFQVTRHAKTLKWLRKEYLKSKIKSLFIAAQNHEIRTNHGNARIENTQIANVNNVVIETKRSISL